MKNLLIAVSAVALLAAPGCKKDKKKEGEKTAQNPCAAKKNPCADKNPCAKKNPCADKNPCAGNPCAAKDAVPKVELTGSAAENMVWVFAAGAKAVSAEQDPKKAAALLTGMLGAYNVGDLRAKSKADKEAGKGASDELKKQFADAKEMYKKAAEALGKKDAAAFGPANEAWAKAWGLN